MGTENVKMPEILLLPWEKAFFTSTIPGLKNGPSTSCWKSLKSQTNSTLSQRKTVQEKLPEKTKFSEM